MPGRVQGGRLTPTTPLERRPFPGTGGFGAHPIRGGLKWIVLIGVLALPWNTPSPLPSMLPQAPPPPTTQPAGASPLDPSRPPLVADAAGIDRGESQRDSRVDEFQLLLESGKFGAAVSRYEAIYDAFPLAESEPYRELLVSYAANLLQAGDAGDTVALLEAYLSIFYRDSDALVVLGQGYRSAGDFPASIWAFQHARLYSHLPTMRSLIADQLNWVVSVYSQRLRDEERPDEIADIFTGLMITEPDNPHYAVGLAKAHMENAKYDDAIRALSPVLNDAFVGQRARQLLREIRTRADYSG